jgi:Xaa-Pro dipeptidase
MAEMNEARFAPAWASSGLKDHGRQIDMARLRACRLGRLHAELKQHDYAAALLLDPINIRYATGSRNMSLWTAHTPARYCLVPADGKAILWDFHNCEHLSAGLETIAETRPAHGFYFLGAGSRVDEKAIS